MCNSHWVMEIIFLLINMAKSKLVLYIISSKATLYNFEQEIKKLSGTVKVPLEVYTNRSSLTISGSR